MTTFFLVMCLHPHVQERAQAEVDSVTGRARLPTCSDLDSLPYVKRVMQEILRWAPVAPVGAHALSLKLISTNYNPGAALPHCLTQDDEYMGYRMQKSATVYANLWSVIQAATT